MGVEASVIVVLDDGTVVTDSVTVELDDTHTNNLDSNNNLLSTFSPTDKPVFLIKHDANLVITKVDCTDGKVSFLKNNEVRSRSVDILMADVNTQISLSYTDSIYNSVKWSGNTAIVYQDGDLLKVSSGTFPCFGVGSYSVTFNKQYQLTPPTLTLTKDEIYQIYVVIYVRRI